MFVEAALNTPLEPLIFRETLYFPSAEGPKFMANDLTFVTFETWPDFVTIAKYAIGSTTGKRVGWYHGTVIIDNEYDVKMQS